MTETKQQFEERIAAQRLRPCARGHSRADALLVNLYLVCRTCKAATQQRYAEKRKSLTTSKPHLRPFDLTGVLSTSHATTEQQQWLALSKKERDLRFVEEYESGISCAQIGQKYGVSHETVRLALKRQSKLLRSGSKSQHPLAAAVQELRKIFPFPIELEIRINTSSKAEYDIVKEKYDAVTTFRLGGGMTDYPNTLLRICKMSSTW